MALSVHKRCRIALVARVVLLGGVIAGAFGAEAALVRRTVDKAAGTSALLLDTGDLYFEATPRRGEGLIAFARRTTGADKNAAAIAKANGNPKKLLAGVRYRVPFEFVTAADQRAAVRVLFPKDRAVTEGWRHRVRGVGKKGRESFVHLARWFTPSEANAAELAKANKQKGKDVAAGVELTIPLKFLRPAFRDAVAELQAPRAGPAPEPSVAPAAPAPVAPKPPLTIEAPPVTISAVGPSALRPASDGAARGFGLAYGDDADGEYAVYRLRAGEALYSSVVVRFTGRILAQDVNALAADIAKRSGIEDVTDIPVGYRVKIPLDLLLPEFLPAGHPRRLEYESQLAESSQFTNQVQAADLQGITVILDAGHGGPDPGASFGGVWESVYVYDIQLRVRRLLLERTGAEVFLTTRQGNELEILDRDVLPFSKDRRILTNPPYPVDTGAGVHLRWYLANSLFNRALRDGGDPHKVVFLSIHADSLHPSLRGAMVYIPGADLRGGRFRKDGATYASRAEWREQPEVAFTREERVESEGLSRQLALQLIKAFGKKGIATHPFKPVRERIIRQRGAFVPAVLRYNAIPASLLLEVSNLANVEDRELLQTRAFREAIAEGVVDAILAYYGQGAAAAPARSDVAAR
jgi:N-acetylmuramoyl-L-alanine amidase